MREKLEILNIESQGFKVESNRPQELMGTIESERKRLENLYAQDMVYQANREKEMQQVLSREDAKKEIGNEDLFGVLPDGISQKKVLEHLKNREGILKNLQQEVNEMEEDLSKFGPMEAISLLSEMSPIRAVLLGNPETRRIISHFVKIKKKKAEIKKLEKKIRAIRKAL